MAFYFSSGLGDHINYWFAVCDHLWVCFPVDKWDSCLSALWVFVFSLEFSRAGQLPCYLSSEAPVPASTQISS